MSINIQLVEVPDTEQVASRQLVLPAEGGSIGRAYDCTIQLPDFSKTLSRVHAQISLDSNGRYQVVNKSTNGLTINGAVLKRGQYKNINDGDVWKLGDYVMLISNMSALVNEETDIELDIGTAFDEQVTSDPLFSLDDLDFSDTGAIDSERLRMRDETSDGFIEEFENHDSGRIKNDSTDMFNTQSLLDEVQVGLDPFEEGLQMQDAHSSYNQGLTVENDNSTQLGLLRQNLMQITQLMAQQSDNNSLHNYDVIVECVNSSMDKFIEELSPDFLEEMFKDSISGWGSRDKKYWRLYRKQFKRKLERREFHRQFTSIFLEELRRKV